MIGRLRRRLGAELAFYRRLARDPRVPRPAKWLLAAAVAYILSPIDLVPDFIPVLGHADDVLVAGALCWLALRIIPAGVVTELRPEASDADRARRQVSAGDARAERSGRWMW